MISEHEILYLSGAITSDPHFREKFADAQMVLEELGYIVINPCILPAGMTYEQYMKIDLCFVETADVICMLPDWKKSPGAKIEKYHAEEEKKRVILYEGLDTAKPRW